MKQKYEHFVRLVHETHRKLFYVSTEGYAYSCDKFSGKQHPLKKSLHGGRIRVAIHGLNHPALKRLIWQISKGSIFGDYHVRCKDGNEFNCNIENLSIISKKEAARLTGPLSRSREVIIQDKKDIKKFCSVRKAAKSLFVSYQTLLDYLAKNRVKQSVLSKRGRKIYYAHIERKTYYGTKKNVQ